MRGGGASPGPDLARQREVVEAFLAALRAGDFEGLLAVLDPDLVVRADMAAGAPTAIRGAANWAKGAVAFGHLARQVRPALVNGAIGLVRITGIEVIGNPARLGELEVSLVE